MTIGPSEVDTVMMTRPNKPPITGGDSRSSIPIVGIQACQYQNVIEDGIHEHGNEDAIITILVFPTPEK